MNSRTDSSVQLIYLYGKFKSTSIGIFGNFPLFVLSVTFLPNCMVLVKQKVPYGFWFPCKIAKFAKFCYIIFYRVDFQGWFFIAKRKNTLSQVFNSIIFKLIHLYVSKNLLTRVISILALQWYKYGHLIYRWNVVNMNLNSQSSDNNRNHGNYMTLPLSSLPDLLLRMSHSFYRIETWSIKITMFFLTPQQRDGELHGNGQTASEWSLVGY